MVLCQKGSRNKRSVLFSDLKMKYLQEFKMYSFAYCQEIHLIVILNYEEKVSIIHVFKIVTVYWEQDN